LAYLLAHGRVERACGQAPSDNHPVRQFRECLYDKESRAPLCSRRRRARRPSPRWGYRPGRHFGVGLNFTVRNGLEVIPTRIWKAVARMSSANPEAAASPPNGHSGLPSTSESRDDTACLWPRVAPRHTPFRASSASLCAYLRIAGNRSPRSVAPIKIKPNRVSIVA
jgi:hypothetical protein